MSDTSCPEIANPEEFVPTAIFKPIVPLPPLLNLVKGTENESTIFTGRAKLFRFVDNKWKERGIGNILILESKDALKYRVLMLNEGSCKMILNHWVTKEFQIAYHRDSLKSVRWAAQNVHDDYDFVQAEVLAASFLDEEMCATFKSTIEKCAKQSTFSLEACPSDSQLKREPIRWECRYCKQRNTNNEEKCVRCKISKVSPFMFKKS